MSEIETKQKIQKSIMRNEIRRYNRLIIIRYYWNIVYVKQTRETNLHFIFIFIVNFDFKSNAMDYYLNSHLF